MYLQGQPIAFNPWTQGFKTPEEIVNYLSDKFIKESNYYVPKISCAEFEARRAANQPLTVYVGSYANVFKGKPLHNLNQLHLFDLRSFKDSTLGLYVFDWDNEEDIGCLGGASGLPEKDKKKTKEGLYYFYHKDAAPEKINREDAKRFHDKNFREILQSICRVEMDLKMLWNRCSYFLLSQAKENAIVLVTADKWIDPSEHWLGEAVI